MIVFANRSTHEVYNESYYYAIQIDENNLLPGDGVSLSFKVDAAACAQFEDGPFDGFHLDDVFSADLEASTSKYVVIDFVVARRQHVAYELVKRQDCFLGGEGQCMLEPATPQASEALEWLFKQHKPAWEVEA